MEYDGDMDPEAISLCDALNLLDGIATRESCCGHGQWPFKVFFAADSFDHLANLSYLVDGCHSGVYGWNIRVFTDCAAELSFVLESTEVGEVAYAQALTQAAHVRGDTNEWQDRLWGLREMVS